MLADTIRGVLPGERKQDQDLSIRRVFQALRILVNDEFSALEMFLRNLPGCLKTGGRVAVPRARRRCTTGAVPSRSRPLRERRVGRYRCTS